MLLIEDVIHLVVKEINEKKVENRKEEIVDQKEEIIDS